MIGPWFVYFITVVYVLASFGYIYDGKPGSALMFFSYSIANVGFLWATEWK